MNLTISRGPFAVTLAREVTDMIAELKCTGIVDSREYHDGGWETLVESESRQLPIHAVGNHGNSGDTWNT